ncbi:hypothetical protein HMPREF3156_00300, partial [Neisseria sp. HMSC06F02]
VAHGNLSCRKVVFKCDPPSSEKARIRGFQTTFPLFFLVCRLKAGR